VLARLDRLEKRIAITGTPSAAVVAPAPAVPAQDRPSAASAPTSAEPPLEINPVVRPVPPTAHAAPPSAAEPQERTPSPQPAPETVAARPPAPESVAAQPPSAQPSAPAPEPLAAAPSVTEPSTPEPSVAASAAPQPTPGAAAPAGGLSLVDVRRLWPDIVEATKLRRRVTWMHLTQNCQVVGIDGRVLTLGFSNGGARDSFDNGGSAEIVRQAAIDVVGADWRIETIVDPGAKADPQAPRVTAPATAPHAPQAPPEQREQPAAPAAPSEPPSWATDETAPPADTAPGPEASAGSATPPPAPKAGPDSVAAARAGIQQTRQAGDDRASGSSRYDADADAHPDDLDADNQGLDSAELLRRELGARVIDEIPHS
jgi:DNA polymerase-3 subunit gamma/tau